MRDTTPERARLGALAFVRRGAAVAEIPPLDGTPLSIVDGAPLVSRREADAVYLVLDHRSQPVVRGRAYVEWWPAESPAEAALVGLIVLTATDRPATLRLAPFTCAGLAAALAAPDGAQHAPAPSPGSVTPARGDARPPRTRARARRRSAP